MAGANKATISKKLSPFDFLKTINDTKNNLITEDNENAKYYNSCLLVLMRLLLCIGLSGEVPNIPSGSQ